MSQTIALNISSGIEESGSSEHYQSPYFYNVYIDNNGVVKPFPTLKNIYSLGLSKIHEWTNSKGESCISYLPGKILGMKYIWEGFYPHRISHIKDPYSGVDIELMDKHYFGMYYIYGSNERCFLRLDKDLNWVPDSKFTYDMSLILYGPQMENGMCREHIDYLGKVVLNSGLGYRYFGLMLVPETGPGKNPYQDTKQIYRGFFNEIQNANIIINSYPVHYDEDGNLKQAEWDKIEVIYKDFATRQEKELGENYLYLRRDPYRTPYTVMTSTKIFSKFLDLNYRMINYPSKGSPYIAVKNTEALAYSLGEKVVGPIVMGNRLVFYSTSLNAFVISKFGKYNELQGSNASLLTIAPSARVLTIVKSGASLMSFQSDGIYSYSIADVSEDDAGNVLYEDMLQKDSSFAVSSVIHNPNAVCSYQEGVFFVDKDLGVYYINAEHTISRVIEKLDYKPEEEYSIHLVVLRIDGSDYLSVGDYLYNIGNKTLTRYELDGYWTSRHKYIAPDKDRLYIDYSDRVKARSLVLGGEGLLATYGSLVKILTFDETKKIIENLKQLTPSETLYDKLDLWTHNFMKYKEEGNRQIDGTNYLLSHTPEDDTYNYGAIKHVQTRLHEDETPFTVKAVMIYTSKGFLTEKDCIYIKFSIGGAPLERSASLAKREEWGEKLYYAHNITDDFLPESEREGGFILKGLNITTRRFGVGLLYESQVLDIRGIFINIVSNKKVQSSTTPSQEAEFE